MPKQNNLPLRDLLTCGEDRRLRSSVENNHEPEAIGAFPFHFFEHRVWSVTTGRTLDGLH